MKGRGRSRRGVLPKPPRHPVYFVEFSDCEIGVQGAFADSRVCPEGHPLLRLALARCRVLCPSFVPLVAFVSPVAGANGLVAVLGLVGVPASIPDLFCATAGVTHNVPVMMNIAAVFTMPCASRSAFEVTDPTQNW